MLATIYGMIVLCGPDLPRRNSDVRKEAEPAGNHEVDQVRVGSPQIFAADRTEKPYHG